MKRIVIFASASFYERAVAVKKELETLGYEPVIPQIATEMERTGDYEVLHYKTWYGDPNDYDKKAQLMRGHFDEVPAADAALVLNYEKHGAANYIGGNVLMEMSLAFYLHKPLFILNDIPTESSFLEEILGMGVEPLSGDLKKLLRLLPA